MSDLSNSRRDFLKSLTTTTVLSGSAMHVLAAQLDDQFSMAFSGKSGIILDSKCPRNIAPVLHTVLVLLWFFDAAQIFSFLGGPNQLFDPLSTYAQYRCGGLPGCSARHRVAASHCFSNPMDHHSIPGCPSCLARWRTQTRNPRRLTLSNNMETDIFQNSQLTQ